MVTAPEMSYTISVNGNNKSLGSTTKVSFKPSFNSVVIKHKCLNQSYSWFKVMVNEASDEDYGVNVGNVAVSQSGSMAINTQYTASFNVDNTVFDKGDTTYRLLLCAKGDLDHIWDVTEYFFTVRGLNFITSDGNDLDVYAQD